MPPHRDLGSLRVAVGGVEADPRRQHPSRSRVRRRPRGRRGAARRVHPVRPKRSPRRAGHPPRRLQHDPGRSRDAAASRFGRRRRSPRRRPGGSARRRHLPRIPGTPGWSTDRPPPRVARVRRRLGGDRPHLPRGSLPLRSLPPPRHAPARRPVAGGSPVTTTTPTIRLRRVTKRFGGVAAVEALDLEVPRGELCGVLGPNGAGKSTTIRMIMSIIHPDSGELEVLGASALEAKDRIGYLPEERGLYRKMRVGDFLFYIARLKGLRRREARRRPEAWLDRLELPGVLRRRCEELSKGMQQKVQFAAAVLHEPELLILDEPFSGLDPVNVRTLSRAFREIHAAGTTILYSTHLMSQAEALCDRVVIVDRGRKILDESMTSIRARFDPRTLVATPFDAADLARAAGELGAIPGVESTSTQGGEVSMHLAPDASPERTLAAAAAAIPLRAVRLRQVSLDDVFVDLVGRRPDPESSEAAS
ncbi:MAG: ATP-binding cassette domain-containing protein [Phycisphaerae bacterium]|nr:ATP-binding cassette domain-containing protein [Phycisphaerae bacterium]